jgi:single-strand DNA-binding protein
MNKVILYGNVGKDPESKVINQKTVTKFSLATNKSYSNAQGEKVTDTSWHNIVLWGKVAETASKYVKKGSSIIIEGEISYRSYENKEGQTVYITEIIGHNLHFTGSKETKLSEDDFKTMDREDQLDYLLKELGPENIKDYINRSLGKSGKTPTTAMSDISELPGTAEDDPSYDPFGN